MMSPILFSSHSTIYLKRNERQKVLTRHIDVVQSAAANATFVLGLYGTCDFRHNHAASISTVVFVQNRIRPMQWIICSVVWD